MCGIAGLVPGANDRLAPDLTPRLWATLRDRGPDDRGYLLFSKGETTASRNWREQAEAELLLVHTRLSILDLRESGWQPMSTPDGRYHLVFNGEIYNYLELRAELEKLGYRFRSTTDTETLLYAFAEWGRAVLGRLVGMFAFAVFDSAERRLFLARDPFGVKPLFFTRSNGAFAFGSTLKAVLEFGLNPRQANPDAVYRYLRYGLTDTGDETLFAGIRSLPPAHFLEIGLDKPTLGEPERYWTVDLGARSELSFEEAARTVRELFLKSVTLHMRSDVTLGAALSGGVDSSAIVHAMRELAGSQHPILAFSYTADVDYLSEERWIDLVTATSGAITHKVTPTAEELARDLGDLIRVQEEPFVSTSIYAQWRVFRLAREHGVTVVLDGQGADEILGGYHQYTAARVASLVRGGRLGSAVSLAYRVSNGSRGFPTLLRSCDYLFRGQLQTVARSIAGKGASPSWLNRAWFNRRLSVDGGYLPGRNVLRGELHRTLTSQSLPYLLRYEDRNSMAFSVESRVPFLVPELVSFLFSLPEEYIISNDGVTKSVFRQAMRGLVPDAVLDRRDKIGFRTPELEWLVALTPWVHQVMQSEAMDAVPALNRRALEAEWNEIRLGRRPMGGHLWRCLNLVEWSRLFEVRYH